MAYGLARRIATSENWARITAAKRDRLARGLAEIGFEVLNTEGTYFLTTDFRPLGFLGDDMQFCQHLTKEAGVAAVSFSAVPSGADVKHYARFCFCKRDEMLDAALEKLRIHFVR